MNIHFARTTFCWLPPESLVTPSSTVGALIRRLVAVALGRLVLRAPESTTPRVEILDSLADTIEVLMSSSRLRPIDLRSSLTYASPCAMASDTDLSTISWPSLKICPET